MFFPVVVANEVNLLENLSMAGKYLFTPFAKPKKPPHTHWYICSKFLKIYTMYVYIYICVVRGMNEGEETIEERDTAINIYLDYQINKTSLLPPTLEP